MERRGPQCPRPHSIPRNDGLKYHYGFHTFLHLRNALGAMQHSSDTLVARQGRSDVTAERIITEAEHLGVSRGHKDLSSQCVG